MQWNRGKLYKTFNINIQFSANALDFDLPVFSASLYKILSLKDYTFQTLVLMCRHQVGKSKQPTSRLILTSSRNSYLYMKPGKQ